MNREGAETFLRLLAETEIRGPMTPPIRGPWSGDAPTGSTGRLLMVVAQALTTVHALDGQTAEEILADFDLAAIVRPPQPGHGRPGPVDPAAAARPRPGQLRFPTGPLARVSRVPRGWPIAGTPPVPRPPLALAGAGRRPAPTASEAAPSQRPGPDRADRFVPVGLTVPFHDDEFTGELYVMSYARIASGSVFTMVWRIRSSFAPHTVGPAPPSVLAWLFTVTDDRGHRYDLDFAGSGGPEWAGVLRLRPDPPDDIRWLDFSAPGTSAVRIELDPAVTGGADGAGLDGTGLKISEAELSAGEHLLTMIAERLLMIAADFPHDLWTRLASRSPGPLDAVATGLGEIVAALEAADVLSPLSPVPGWLATLCASLHISGHGITVPPARDLPEPWLSLLAHYQRRKPDTALAHDGYAAVTVALPELDGIRLALLGLHNTDGTTSVQALASGLTPDGRPGPCGIDTYFPLSVWIRDNGGRWHAARPSGWNRAGGEYALRLRLVPPLPRSATWIEVLAAGRSAQVRVGLSLRWGTLRD